MKNTLAHVSYRRVEIERGNQVVENSHFYFPLIPSGVSPFLPSDAVHRAGALAVLFMQCKTMIL